MKGKKSHSHFRNCLSLSTPVVKSQCQCSKSQFPMYINFYPFRTLYKIDFYFYYFIIIANECFLYKLLLSPRDKLKFFFLLSLTFGVVVLIVICLCMQKPLADLCPTSSATLIFCNPKYFLVCQFLLKKKQVLHRRHIFHWKWQKCWLPAHFD